MVTFVSNVLHIQAWCKRIFLPDSYQVLVLPTTCPILDVGGPASDSALRKAKHDVLIRRLPESTCVATKRHVGLLPAVRRRH